MVPESGEEEQSKMGVSQKLKLDIVQSSYVVIVQCVSLTTWGLSIKQKQKTLFDYVMKQRGIMGVDVFAIIADENLPEVTIDEVMSERMNNCEQVTNSKSRRVQQLTG